MKRLLLTATVTLFLMVSVQSATRLHAEPTKADETSQETAARELIGKLAANWSAQKNDDILALFSKDYVAKGDGTGYDTIRAALYDYRLAETTKCVITDATYTVIDPKKVKVDTVRLESTSAEAATGLNFWLELREDRWWITASEPCAALLDLPDVAEAYDPSDPITEPQF